MDLLYIFFLVLIHLKISWKLFCVVDYKIKQLTSNFSKMKMVKQVDYYYPRVGNVLYMCVNLKNGTLDSETEEIPW